MMIVWYEADTITLFKSRNNHSIQILFKLNYFKQEDLKLLALKQNKLKFIYDFYNLKLLDDNKIFYNNLLYDNLFII